MGDLYAEWLRNAAGPMGRLNELEAQGCSVADAGEFRDAEREARGVLRVGSTRCWESGMRTRPGRRSRRSARGSGTRFRHADFVSEAGSRASVTVRLSRLRRQIRF